MGRTQIYLGAEELKLLDRASKESGATRSELVRRAVQAAYGRRSIVNRLDAVRQTSGSWKRPKLTGAKYVDALRRGLDKRLRGLGLE